jgi:NAD(P)-dependent dehydrogenase (short-subunit alcohol dehydrogenase family)
VLTARDEDRGKKAVEALKREGLDNVIFHPLDVQSEESSHNLAQWLSQNYGGIDILVSKTGFYGVTVVRHSIPQLFPIHADSWNFFLLVSERKSI